MRNQDLHLSADWIARIQLRQRYHIIRRQHPENVQTADYGRSKMNKRLHLCDTMSPS